ncbi:FAD /NAD-P-binding domain-containing protein [Favolaschia claudopus]|uniref:FAD /NAD-P-binding domain-containing protein n=1 Tax=Favolaschia claudopus TaxID=2862362 RepID=A0AAW0DAF0_9AGAR
MPQEWPDPLTSAIAIIGSGPAGLITAHTLLQDGFSQVQILTRDSTVGGVWAADRVYPGLQINNVHGEYRFSALKMPPAEGGRLTGHDLRAYMEAFSQRFQHIIRFNTEVVHIRRDETTSLWYISLQDKITSTLEVLVFDRVVLCTGGCSTPNIPQPLSVAAATQAGFQGPVIHSMNFASQIDRILESTTNIKVLTVIVGGGRSAQDMAAYLANQGRKVKVVFEMADAILASPSPLPAFVRKSRLLSIFFGYSILRSRLERFLHTTRLGAIITGSFWSTLSAASLASLSVPNDSPLRNIRSLFWTTSTNDEGVPNPNRFHALVNAGKIELVSPARVRGFTPGGKCLTLSDGHMVDADVVLLATGHASSWTGLFDENTANELGINRHPPGSASSAKSYTEWDNYRSLANPPKSRPDSVKWAATIYNGIVPAKNITRRDFAINGASFTANVGYSCEVQAHWISSYFLGDQMSIPKTPEEAYERAERDAAWVRKRHPDALLRWPQYTDHLLEEMGLSSMRSGGNWLTWPFKIIDVKEIANLSEERRQSRIGAEPKP